MYINTVFLMQLSQQHELTMSSPLPSQILFKQNCRRNSELHDI